MPPDMKRNLILTVCAVVTLGMISSRSFAADAKKKTAYHHNEDVPLAQQPDTDSCGLGWQVTQKKTLSAKTTRGTTNAFVPPTFGMTTGTIGCAQHPLSKRDVEGALYATTNFDELSVEMAEGQGEFLKG